MKVILLKDVAKVGRRGDIKDVADGFAQNSLFPRGLAEQATEGKINALKKKKAEKEESAQKILQKQIEMIKNLDGNKFEIKERADKKGHLYQKINLEKIANKLGVEASSIVLDNPIKETGEHEIILRIGKIESKVTMDIAAE